MKFLFCFILFFPVTVFSQELQIKISFKGEITNISLNDDNKNKLISISKQNAQADNFLINVTNDEIEKDWERKFSIYDADDKAVADFLMMKNGSYCLKAKDINALLKDDKDYFIYTIATPKDPKTAMQVRLARMLVCRLRLAD